MTAHLGAQKGMNDTFMATISTTFNEGASGRSRLKSQYSWRV